tara:strand:+ start:5726 stop:6190 length:465 start_codon:yes stop_codon:yes gene_type:complete
MIELSWTDIQNRARQLVESKIAFIGTDKSTEQKDSSFIQVYPVSNGGIHAAQAIQAEFYGLFPFLWDDGSFTGGGLDLVDSPGSAQVFIDDLIETGETRKNYSSCYPEIPFLSLVDKLGQDQDMKAERIQFPWNSRFKDCPTCGRKRNCDTTKN